ncbi:MULTISPECIES: hypothetical protein [unclassified Streptomyces]|uniref:hypothetical protein n=1 Tax=unclassified Streptomyces TaxID=2593676 RepID=UPI0007EDE8E7|nr:MULTISPECIES: hypothetical protein [unclassified Streptomyces]MCP3771564.1 hypothetical protein [Streptomyces sp. MAR25Y5]OBQ50445.1 hypothetical protein A4U61_09530 [Streptomyces sp. H-KF8]
MKARIVEAQADLFEVGVLSQTAEVESVPMDRLLADPSGPPLVVVGGLLDAERLVDMRKLSSALARSGVAVIVVPPFTDLGLGRYFDTPVQLGARRRAADSVARITDGVLEEDLGGGVKVRSDHFFDTALGAGVLALDAQNKPVLLRYQATNTAGPVFFSALQLLTYTALTDEAHRQSLLGHLLSWTPSVTAEAREIARQRSNPPKAETVGEGVLVPVALLLAAGGPQTAELLRSRAGALLGVDLSANDVGRALEELTLQGLAASGASAPSDREALVRFLEQRGMHPYLRELGALLASEETTT